MSEFELKYTYHVSVEKRELPVKEIKCKLFHSSSFLIDGQFSAMTETGYNQAKSGEDCPFNESVPAHQR